MRVGQDMNTLFDPKVLRQVVYILHINNVVASVLKDAYLQQLGRIFMEFVYMYKTLSARVSDEINRNGTSFILVYVKHSYFY